MSDTQNGTNFWRTKGWAELPFFLAVARMGSLRAAANDLGINHATVNRNINELEALYNVRLFDRTTRGFVLTPAGRDLLSKAENAESAVIAAQRSVSGRDAKLEGPVNFTVSSWITNYMLSRELPRFRKLYPHIDLTITVEDRVANMANSPCDISYRGAWSVDDNATGRRLYTYCAAVLASDAYLDKHWASRGPNGEGLHWIGQSTLWPNPALEELNLFPAAERIYDTSDPLLINHMLTQGMGMAIVPFGTVQFLPELRVVPGTPIAEDRSIWLLLQSELKDTARVRAVVEFLAEMAISYHVKELKCLETYPEEVRLGKKLVQSAR